MTGKLPEGPLVSWYGDDFTGAAAVMEVLAFAGLPSALFLTPPDAEQLARMPGLRGIGIAGTARAETPDWMRLHLPEIFCSLRQTGAPILQYKICSTLDSAPEIGSIGCAMEVAAEVLGARFFPIYPSAVPMQRYQAFGHLFASAPGGVFRLDRHPVMARHPVTPMAEADVARHLSAQTALPLGMLTLDALHGGKASQALAEMRAAGVHGICFDTISTADQRLIGELLWQVRGPKMLCVASQGLEYALVSHWQAAGLLPVVAPPGSAGVAGPIAAVSGSVSPVTAAQIDDALARGFVGIALDPSAIAQGNRAAVEAATAQALLTLRQGRDVLIHTARGPDDPTVARFRDTLLRHKLDAQDANRAIGATLGDILSTLVRQAGLRRAIISGGDSSGHAARQLGVQSLTALSPTVPGAALCLVQSDDPAINGLQLALKGGQMGTANYFDWIRQGGGS